MTIFSDDRIIENIYDDIGFEDITTNSLVDDDKWAQATVICKEDAVIAGMDVACFILEYFNFNSI